MTVGSIDYTFFNKITIKDIYIEDQQQDTLLFVKKSDAGFSFWQLFKGKVIFNSLRLQQPYFNLKIDKKGKTNIQFLIDAFKQPDNKKPSNVEYRFDKIKLVDSRFSFTNQKNSSSSRPENVFNPKKLKFYGLNADIGINTFKSDTLSAVVNRFSAKEKSGLEIVNLKTEIYGSGKGCKMPYLALQLPNSDINVLNVKIRYDSLADFKNIAEDVRWNIPIDNAEITPSDLASFAPVLRRLDKKVLLRGDLSGRLIDPRFHKMELKYGQHLYLNADVDLNGLNHLNETFVYAQINKLQLDKPDVQDVISKIKQEPFVLPDILNQLGTVKYSGNISGFFSNLVAYGTLNTNVGALSTDVLLKFENKLENLVYNGTLKSNNFQLGQLLSNPHLGKTAFNINTKGTKLKDKPMKGTVKAKVDEISFNNYLYKDVDFEGGYDGKGFDGSLMVNDPNLTAQFKGLIDLTQKIPVFNFNLNAARVNLYALNLVHDYPKMELSFNINTNMAGNSPDNLNGSLDIDNITINNQSKTLNIDKIRLNAENKNGVNNLTVESDYINGSIVGDYRYSTINSTINGIVKRYLPSLALKNGTTNNPHPNHVNFDFFLSNTNDISDVLELPYKLEKEASIKGYIDERSNQIYMTAFFPRLISRTRDLRNITFQLQSKQKQLQFTSGAQSVDKSGPINLTLNATAANDSVSAIFNWASTNKKTVDKGEINTTTKLWKEQEKTVASLSVNPSEIIIADSVWKIKPCDIDLTSDNAVSVHNFSFEHKNQYIHIDGVASANESEALNVALNEVDIEYILNLVRLSGIKIGGVATGKASVYSVMKQPFYEANIFVKNVTLNKSRIGDGYVYSTWDKINKVLLSKGVFTDQRENRIDTTVIADSKLFPQADSLELDLNAHHINLNFLNYYFDPVANIKGMGTGNVRISGHLKRLALEGDVYVENGQATVNILKTTYSFSDVIHLRKRTLDISNLKFKDEDNNEGTINGHMTHGGLFQRMKYDFDIRSKNILAMNTQATDNSYFFGKAYTNGRVRISGDVKEVNIDVNAKSLPKTNCFVSMGSASTASDNSFINFINKSGTAQNDNIKPAKTPSNSVNVKTKIQVEVTPDANMELIISPKEGDKITGKGSGNLRIEFDTFSDIKMLGTYVIDNGDYLFTLQNLFRKKFKIDKGSTVTWLGDPFNAQVNIRALYQLTASLKDLDQNQFQSATRTSVNCILKLSDNLMKPTIGFGLEFPTSDESIKQLVRNIINTDEMMTREMLYLLFFGRFYSPEYLANTNSNSSVGSNEALSLATSTLSAQMNNWLSQMIDNKNISFGLDYKQTDQQSSDINAQILYQPSSRLIVNGKFGYRFDNMSNSTTTGTSNNTNRFIGDIDVEWLLNQSGKLRFKAYNHSVDRYYLKSARTTQGVGVIYKEDFNTFNELMKYYWTKLTSTKPAENQAGNDSTSNEKNKKPSKL